jgi:hypothetical protein
VTRAQLTALHNDALHVEHEHLLICYKCRKAGAVVYKRCDEGWRIAKLVLRTKRHIEYYDMDHPDNQERLF